MEFPQLGGSGWIITIIHFLHQFSIQYEMYYTIEMDEIKIKFYSDILDWKCLFNFLRLLINFFNYLIDFDVHFETENTKDSQCPKQNLIFMRDDEPRQHRPVLSNMGLSKLCDTYTSVITKARQHWEKFVVQIDSKTWVWPLSPD